MLALRFKRNARRCKIRLFSFNLRNNHKPGINFFWGGSFKLNLGGFRSINLPDIKSKSREKFEVAPLHGKGKCSMILFLTRSSIRVL